MNAPIRIAVVGLGKIACDQHLPAIARSPDFELVATVSRHGDGQAAHPCFPDIALLAASGIKVDAVALCTPPQVRRAIAGFALDRGWHVFLEKPPSSTCRATATRRSRRGWACATRATFRSPWTSISVSRGHRAGTSPSRRPTGRCCSRREARC